MIPFFQAGNGYLIMIDTDAIKPFFFLDDMVYRDQGLGREFFIILREIDSRERDLKGLADVQRLGHGEMVERGNLLRVCIIQPADTIPVLSCHHRMFEV